MDNSRERRLFPLLDAIQTGLDGNQIDRIVIHWYQSGCTQRTTLNISNRSPCNPFVFCGIFQVYPHANQCRNIPHRYTFTEYQAIRPQHPLNKYLIEFQCGISTAPTKPIQLHIIQPYIYTRNTIQTLETHVKP